MNVAPRVFAYCSLCLIAVVSIQARADAPLPSDWVWIDVDVQRCAAETFNRYVPWNNYQTAVISGTVVRSGFEGSADNSQHEARRSTVLPVPSSSVKYALPKWDDKVCEQIGVGVKRFRFTYDCDAGEAEGKCLSPYRLVQPDLKLQR